MVKNGVKTGAGVSLGMGFKPGTTDLGYRKPSIGALGVEKLALLNSTTSISLFSSFNLVEFVVLDIANFGAEK